MSIAYPIPRGTRQVTPDYLSDGAALTYPIPFYFVDPQDIFVGTRPALGTDYSALTLGSDYSITGAGVAGGGSLKLAAAQPAGTLIGVMGLRIPNRTTSVVNDGVIQADAIEEELDAVELTMQELRRDVTAAGDVVVAQYAAQTSAAAALASQTAAATSASIASAEASVASAIAATNWGVWPTRASFKTTVIAAGMQTVLCLGLNAVGDSPPAVYSRVASQPSHQGRVQTADGGWWVLSGPQVYPQQIHATGNADDSPWINYADTVALAIGAELVINQVHTIASIVIFQTQPRFASSGRIKPSAAGQVQFTSGFVAEPHQYILDTSLIGAGSAFPTARVTATCVSPFMFGAAADGVTDDYHAVSQAFAAAIASNLPIKLYNGKFKLGSVLNVDVTAVAATGLTVEGDGCTKAQLDFTGITTGKPFQIYSTADWLRLRMRGFSVVGAIAGPLTTIGKDDLSDPCNAADIQDFASLNSLNNAANEALRLNYFLNGVFVNCQFNAYSNGAGTNAGTGIKAHQVEFTEFVGGSCGGAYYAVLFDTGVSFCFNFNGTTFEETNYCLYSNSANNGLHIIKGGEMTAVASYCASAPVGRSDGVFTLDNVNYGGANIIDPANCAGIVVRDLRPFPTPALVASGASLQNTSGRSVLIAVAGSGANTIKVDGVTVNGSTGQTVYAVARAGSMITPTYGSGSSWNWFPI